MKYALINPAWTFDRSIYFGCREPHLPLEFGYAKTLLEQQGHDVLLIDGHLENLTHDSIVQRAAAFRPNFAVIPTAPTYLFWRCAPPELRVPQELATMIRPFCEAMVVVGPHASTTPRTTLRKLGADVAILGECEEVLPRLSGLWSAIDSIAWFDDGAYRSGRLQSSDMKQLPALRWNNDAIARHQHHHHRFDQHADEPGAEMETSRGCPYHCTFCAKDNFRDQYRRRPLSTLLEELDGLIDAGARYVYFIDEIFLPQEELLKEVLQRKLRFGVQTRIDLWKPEMLDLLGEAGCVSVEAGIESISEAGRNLLDKHCRLSTSELTDRLIYAKRRIPFVQANLIQLAEDDITQVESFRQAVMAHGIWANQPVPLFPYPGSPEYSRRWGAVDDHAWERSHAYYLGLFHDFSDVQDQAPAPLSELELSVAA